MLVEHDRYFYQRKVPTAFQAVVGRSKWRAPLGPNFEAAYDKLRELRDQHDALLKRLENPEERQNFHTSRRCEMESKQAAEIDADYAKYREWCHANGHKAEEEEFWEEEERKITSGQWEKIPDWEHADGMIEAI